MTNRNGRHGQNRHEILNLPIRRDEIARRKHDHARQTEHGEEHAELEFLEHFGHLDEEVGELGFFGGGAPGHVDLEHVREEGLRDVEGEAAEEDAEHECPFEVHYYCLSGVSG